MEIIQLAKRFFYGTFLSRLTGGVRDISLAYFFGSSSSIAAFMLAYRFAFLLRRLFAESSMQPTIIPHLQSMDQKSSAYFFRDITWSMVTFLFLVCLGGQLALTYSEGSFDAEVAGYVKILLWGLVFVCLYGLESSFLLCQKKYFLPAFAPAIFNVLWIVFIALSFYFQNMGFLTWGVVGSFFIQWLFVLVPNISYYRKHLEWKEWFIPNLFSAEIRSLIKPILLVILGIGAVQINSAIDGIFAYLVSSSGPAYLWYAMRLQQLPLALFGVSVASAVLPSLSKSSKEGNAMKFVATLQGALRSTSLLMIPATLALLVLGGVLVNLVYGRGAFGQEARVETMLCLIGYAFAIYPSALSMLFSASYYAKKEYRRPTFIACACVLLNLLFNSIFIYVLNFGVYSVALATSLSSWFQCWALSRGIENGFSTKIRQFCQKVFFASGLAGSITYVFNGLIFEDPIYLLLKKGVFGVFRDGVFAQVVEFGVLAIIYATVFVTVAYMLKFKEKIIQIN